MQLDDELKFGMTKLIIDDEEEQENHSDFDEEFLKPTTLIYEEELPEHILPQKRKENESPEIRLIKLRRKEPEEEYLFSHTKLDLDDELDNESNEDEYLFKPVDLVYEDPLEVFNKKREKTQNLNPLKLLNNTSLNKEKDSNIKKNDDEIKMEEKILLWK